MKKLNSKIRFNEHLSDLLNFPCFIKNEEAIITSYTDEVMKEEKELEKAKIWETLRELK